MERLTMTSDKGGVAFTFDLDVSCRPSEAQKILKLAQKLYEYEQAEEQGLLLKLPCKVGDTIYYIDDYEIYWSKVHNIDISKENGEYIFCIAFMDYKADDFGKTVFLTKAEAEKALAEMGE